MKAFALAASIAWLVLSPTAYAGAQDRSPSEPQAEKEARKACEARICDILATRDPVGANATCDLVKTWPATEIVSMLGGRIDWPWGDAMCQSKVTVERTALVRAINGDTFEMTMPPQNMRCELAQKADGEPYVLEVSIAPKVKFENGKAVEGQVNWGKASAPVAIYPLIYAGTALDNSANMFGPEVVRVVNEFAGKHCTHMKAALPGRGQD